MNMTIIREFCYPRSADRIAEIACPGQKLVEQVKFGVGSSNFDSTQVLDRTNTNRNGFGVLGVFQATQWVNISAIC